MSWRPYIRSNVMSLVYPGQFASIPAYMTGTNVFFEDFEYYNTEDTEGTGSIQQPTEAYGNFADGGWTTLQGVPGYVSREDFEILDTITDILTSDDEVGSGYGWDQASGWFTPRGVRSRRPVISPASGVMSDPVTVTITAELATSVYYTTDGTQPNSGNGTLYSSSFDVAVGTTVKAAAYEPGKLISQTATVTYFSVGSLSDLQASPNGANQVGVSYWQINSPDEDVTIYYTIGTPGSPPADPTQLDTELTGPVSIDPPNDCPVRIKARGYDETGGGLGATNVLTHDYTYPVASDFEFFFGNERVANLVGEENFEIWPIRKTSGDYAKAYPDGTEPDWYSDYFYDRVIDFQAGGDAWTDTLLEITYVVTDIYGAPLFKNDPSKCMASTKKYVVATDYANFDVDTGSLHAVQALQVELATPTPGTAFGQTNDGWDQSADMSLTLASTGNPASTKAYKVHRCTTNGTPVPTGEDGTIETITPTGATRILAFIKLQTKGTYVASSTISNPGL